MRILKCKWSLTWRLHRSLLSDIKLPSHPVRRGMLKAVNSEQFVSELLIYSGWHESRSKLQGAGPVVLLRHGDVLFLLLQVWNDDEVLEQRAREEAYFPGSEWQCSISAALQLQAGESPCDLSHLQTPLDCEHLLSNLPPLHSWPLHKPRFFVLPFIWLKITPAFVAMLPRKSRSSSWLHSFEF